MNLTCWDGGGGGGGGGGPWDTLDEAATWTRGSPEWRCMGTGGRLNGLCWMFIIGVGTPIVYGKILIGWCCVFTGVITFIWGCNTFTGSWEASLCWLVWSLKFGSIREEQTFLKSRYTKPLSLPSQKAKRCPWTETYIWSVSFTHTPHILLKLLPIYQVL